MRVCLQPVRLNTKHFAAGPSARSDVSRVHHTTAGNLTSLCDAEAAAAAEVLSRVAAAEGAAKAKAKAERKAQRVGDHMHTKHGT